MEERVVKHFEIDPFYIYTTLTYSQMVKVNEDRSHEQVWKSKRWWGLWSHSTKDEGQSNMFTNWLVSLPMTFLMLLTTVGNFLTTSTSQWWNLTTKCTFINSTHLADTWNKVRISFRKFEGRRINNHIIRFIHSFFHLFLRRFDSVLVLHNLFCLSSWHDW